MPIEFAQRIRRIPVYPAAGGYAQEQPLVRLASNETPFPPLQAVRDAVQHAFDTVNRYPDPSNSLLRRRLAERYEVPSESRIAIGNGSCDILLAAGEALLEPGAELVYAWPSFSVYPHLAAASGARAITVALDAQERHDLDAMLREITVATRLVLVCNPNNPTSTALPLDQIAGFVAEVPRHACVILDEAYCEFNLLEDPEATIELLAQQPQSDPAARPSPRCTACAGCASATRCAARRELPRRPRPGAPAFFCNALAQAAAVEALAHQDSSSTASPAPSPSASPCRSGCSRSACGSPTRRPTSAGSSWGRGAMSSR